MRASDQKGIAIISALGVLVILGLLASVFSAHMRLESAYSTKDAQDFKAHYLAVAGIQDAIARLRADPPLVDAYGENWWPGVSPDMTPMGEGGYTLTISDESARINVFSASPQTLSAILGGDKEALGAVLNYRSSAVHFSVEDLMGAGLPADALSRVITLGTTIGDGKVNINTANADVIAALPGMDPDAAQLVVEFRRGADGIEGTGDDYVFSGPENLSNVPGLTPVRTAPAIPLIKFNTDIFRVESVGSIYKGTQIVSNKRITAVLHRDENGNVNIMSWEGS